MSALINIFTVMMARGDEIYLSSVLSIFSREEKFMSRLFFSELYVYSFVTCFVLNGRNSCFKKYSIIT